MVLLPCMIGTAALAGMLAAIGFVGLGLLALPIGAILAALLSLGRNSVFSALGVFYAGLPAVALIWLRSDASLGLLAVIFLLVVVVTADTASFVAGRLFGRAEAVAQRFAQQDMGWPDRRAGRERDCRQPCSGLPFLMRPRRRLAATGAVLALVAQAGDLAESALKRRFGAKDSGTIIPGHGGFMDRVDGLVAAAAAVGIAAIAIDVHSPARALLFGS